MNYDNDDVQQFALELVDYIELEAKKLALGSDDYLDFCLDVFSATMVGACVNYLMHKPLENRDAFIEGFLVDFRYNFEDKARLMGLRIDPSGLEHVN